MTERIYSLWTRIRFSLYPFTVNVLSAIYERLIKKNSIFASHSIGELLIHDDAMRSIFGDSKNPFPRLRFPQPKKKRCQPFDQLLPPPGRRAFISCFRRRVMQAKKRRNRSLRGHPGWRCRRERKKTMPNKTGHGLAPYWTLTLWTKNRQQNRKNWWKTNACVAKTVSAPSKRVSLFANWNLFPIIPNAKRQSVNGPEW